MAVNKIYASAADALAGLLHDGMTIMSGGFGLCGIPSALIEAIRSTFPTQGAAEGRLFFDSFDYSH